jgi:hypothetical protein
MNLDSSSYNEFVRAYMFANNASQLFKQFSSLINKNGISLGNEEDIIKEYRETASNEIADFDSLIKAYIILVAITNLNYEQAERVLDKLDLSFLQWGLDIKNIYQQTRRSTSLVYLDVRPQIQIYHLDKNQGATNRKELL